MNERSEQKKVLKITHSGEFLFWLIIILFFVALSSTGIIFKEHFDKNDYQIFLQDVDGLIVGSPVRMMGIEIGHITKIKPTNNEIFVELVITNPDVYIPQGTKATVEFTGLAGSKSLELYLPQENSYIDKSTPVLSVEPPKRLHDALGLLNEMFKKLNSIIYTTSDFGNKLQQEDLKSIKFENSNKNIKEFLKYSDIFLEDSNTKAIEMRKSLEGLKKNAN